MAEQVGYEDIIERVEDLFLILERWKAHFGSGFEATWDGTQRVDQSQMRTIEDLVQTAQSHLNQRDRQGRLGEASLLIRDPREDRLVLIWSTSTNLRDGQANTNDVRDPSHYFDDARRCYFYPLFDRLVQPKERNSRRSRDSRGLTGWVAVTGHHLLVNGRHGKQRLGGLDEDRPETKRACQTYGYPSWGHHVCDFPYDPARPNRYVAVPVKSTADTTKTIGVLRYVCSCSGKELSDADLCLMRELADLISASLGLDATITRALRGSHITERKENLRRSYNFGEYLEFVAHSLRSSIASIYLDVRGIVGESESNLRLLDAFGIIEPVAYLRNGLKDYLPGEGGFTRYLFDAAPKEPSVQASVHLHGSWKGKNILAFYGQHFKALIKGGEEAEGELTEVAKRYKIKIMGMPLFCGDERVGVIKVELPNSFDDSRHYDKDDQAFFAEAAAALGEVVGEFRSFLRCELFARGQSPHVVGNLARMIAELLRTRVVSPSEAAYFWGELRSFVVHNEAHINDELSDVLDRLPPAQKEVIQRSRTWIEEFNSNVFTELIAKLLVEAAIRTTVGGQ